MGLAHYLYWPTFFKRNGIKFWLIFLEKFGMPTAAAKLPPGQKSVEMMKEPLADEAVETVRNASFFGAVDGVSVGEEFKVQDLIAVLQKNMATTNIWQQFKSLIPEGARTVVTITSNNGDGTSSATLRDGMSIRVQGETVVPGNKALIEDRVVKVEVPGLAVYEAEI